MPSELHPNPDRSKRNSRVQVHTLAKALSVAVVLLAACRTNANPVAVIVLSYPSGELSLRVGRDQASRLTYGELPEGLTIERGVFDLDELYGQLQGKLNEVVPSEKVPAGKTIGTVSFVFADGSQESYFIYDEAFSFQLLANACSHADFNETLNSDIYQTACSKLDS